MSLISDPKSSASRFRFFVETFEYAASRDRELLPRLHPVLYILHSSQLYGTERMALATAEGLRNDFETIFIGPPGPALAQARRLGFETRQFVTSMELAFVLRPLLARYPSLTCVGTGPRYNLVCMAVNLLYGRRIKHIQMVHGGTGDSRDAAANLRKDYARKKLLNSFNVTFVTVSDWSRRRLLEFGVRNPIEVVGNFLTPARLRDIPTRPAYTRPGIRKVVVASRVDHVKRIDLLLTALDRHRGGLRDISFRILGSGPELENLCARVRHVHPNVNFAGFSDNVAAEMAQADLLLHLCPIEPFGLVVLEAMAARLLALVPNRGGVTSIVRDGETGFMFRADDVDHLAERLIGLKQAPPELLNQMVRNAQRRLEHDFSADASIRRYRDLFAPLAA